MQEEYTVVKPLNSLYKLSNHKARGIPHHSEKYNNSFFKDIINTIYLIDLHVARTYAGDGPSGAANWVPGRKGLEIFRDSLFLGIGDGEGHHAAITHAKHNRPGYNR